MDGRVGGVSAGEGGVLIALPDADPRKVGVHAGALCSSTRAELVALHAAVCDPDVASAGRPVIICLDSRAALQTIDAGPSAQTSQLGADIWRQLLAMAARGTSVHLQWVPAHCGLTGNERADRIAKRAAELDQATVPIEPRASPAPPPG